MSDSLSATVQDLDALPDADERSPAWAAVLALALGVFGLVTAEFLPASLLTPIAADLGISDGAAGQTVTATALIGAVAGLFTPIVTGRLDRRLVMWALTGLLIVSSVLAALANGLTMLLVARLLLGIGIGGFWSMAGAMAMRLVPSRLVPRAMSLIFTGVSVATVSAAPIGAYLGGLIGWRMVFTLAALIGVVTLVAQLATFPRMPPQGAPSARTLVELLGRPGVRLVLLTILLCISGHFAGFTYVRPFLEQVPALSVEMISLVLLAYGVGGFFGNFAGAAVVERSAKASVVTGALLIAVMALGLTLFGASLPVSAVGVAFWGFAFGMIPVGVQTWIIRAAPDQAEAASGLIVAAFQIAIASGAVFGGLLVDHLGALGAIGYCGLGTLLGALLALSARRGQAAL
ncbi:MFS transporter [Bosea sp. BK604]|uniref:MFS transporter n=1 Tax=Bosea sp. BK604 TaxID=2512180 RepID=UPI00104F4D79|nr:MFS transporter [Bosea sp. BK604]TCR61851.1 DHA1 family purine ribonucleoside efflux pump-like MFS transporter [Bosea sp. BK604]